MRTGAGKAEEKQRNRTRVVDAIRNFHSVHIIISVDRGCCLRAPDIFALKARYLCKRIAPGGNRVRGTGRNERGRGRDRSLERERRRERERDQRREQGRSGNDNGGGGERRNAR